MELWLTLVDQSEPPVAVSPYHHVRLERVHLRKHDGVGVEVKEGAQCLRVVAPPTSDKTKPREFKLKALFISFFLSQSNFESRVVVLSSPGVELAPPPSI